MSAHTERYDYTRVFRDLTSGSHLFSFNGSSTTFGFVQVRRARIRPFKHVSSFVDNSVRRAQSVGDKL